MKTCISFLFSFLAAFGLYAQNAEQAYNYAREAYSAGNYEETISTCRRIIYFDEKYASAASLLIADSYFSQKQYTEAATSYENAYYYAGTDSLKQEIVLQKAASLLLSEKYLQAKAELLNLPDNPLPPIALKRNIYGGICSYMLSDYEGASSYFEAAYGNNNDSLKYYLHKLKKANRLNPKVARTLSLILPGSGQLYGGDVQNALNSMAIIAGFGILYAYTAYTYSHFDAFISIFPWFQRYYVGGAKSAYRITYQKRDTKRKEVLTRIIALPKH